MHYFYTQYSIRHPFLKFLLSISAGIFTFLACAILIIGVQKGLSPSSFSIDTMPRHKLISLQVVQMICLFVIPPIIFALLSKSNFTAIYRLQEPLDWKKYALAAAFALMVFPLLVSLAHWVEFLPWPEQIKVIADQEKALIDAAMEFLLNSKDFGNFLIMLFIVGLGAGLTEELFFRGLLIPLLTRSTKFVWMAILVSAIIFSLLHFSIYNFFPILLIGLLFGYLFVKVQDLKLNIFIHAFFNGTQVCLNYLHQIGWMPQDMNEIDSFPILIVIATSAIAILIYTLLIRTYGHVSD